MRKTVWCSTASQIREQKKQSKMPVSIEIATQDIPSDFVCPITCDIIRDPLMCRSGLSFERNAILSWLHRNPNGKCPITRQPLSVRDLVPNWALQGRIQSWCSSNGIDLSRGNDIYDESCGSMTYLPDHKAVVPCYMPGVALSDIAKRRPKRERLRM